MNNASYAEIFQKERRGFEHIEKCERRVKSSKDREGGGAGKKETGKGRLSFVSDGRMPNSTGTRSSGTSLL
jgi:hypothetical protein